MTQDTSVKKMRIAKSIADRGYCSRRAAETLILENRVCVNKVKVLTPAFLVTANDVISIDGKDLPLAASRPRLWCFYKPKGLVTSHQDPEGRPTVFSFLKETYPKLPRVISVGRLDITSEGLLILTTSGLLARHMELPATKWIRTYRARIFGTLHEEVLKTLQKGIIEKGIFYKPHRLSLETPPKKGMPSSRNNWVLISLTTGKNREVRKLFEHVGLQVNRLIRLSYGPFSIENLKIGECKEIPFEDFSPYFPKELKDA